jgi:hypothetical protein
MVFLAILTFETDLSDAIEPIEIPWLPIQVESSITMPVPEFIATQSSWLLTVHAEMVTSEAETSNPSVFAPRPPALPAAEQYRIKRRPYVVHLNQELTIVDCDVLNNCCCSRSNGDGLCRRVKDLLVLLMLFFFKLWRGSYRYILESSRALELDKGMRFSNTPVSPFEERSEFGGNGITVEYTLAIPVKGSISLPVRKG